MHLSANRPDRMFGNAGLGAILAIGLALPAYAQEMSPRPDPPFKGQIGRSEKDSTPDFPKEVAPPKDAPNILLVLTDDAGFGTSSAFGGPIPMPTLERLAQAGVRTLDCVIAK